MSKILWEKSGCTVKAPTNETINKPIYNQDLIL